MGSQHSKHTINKTPPAAAAEAKSCSCKKATALPNSNHLCGPLKSLSNKSEQKVVQLKGRRRTTNDTKKKVHQALVKSQPHSTKIETTNTTTTSTTTALTMSTKVKAKLQLNGTPTPTSAPESTDTTNTVIPSTGSSASDKLISTLDKKVMQLVGSRYSSFKGSSSESEPKTADSNSNGAVDHKRNINTSGVPYDRRLNDRRNFHNINNGDVFIYPPNYRDLNECQKCERDNKICNCIEAEVSSSELLIMAPVNDNIEIKDCVVKKESNEQSLIIEKQLISCSNNNKWNEEEDLDEEELDNPVKESSGEQSSDSWRSSSNASDQSVDESLSQPIICDKTQQQLQLHQQQQPQQQFKRVYKISITTAVIDHEKNRLELSAPRFIAETSPRLTTSSSSTPTQTHGLDIIMDQSIKSDRRDHHHHHRASTTRITSGAILSTSHAAQILPCLTGHADGSLENSVVVTDLKSSKVSRKQPLVRSRAKSIPAHLTAAQETHLQVASLSSISECLDSMESSKTNSTKTLLTSTTSTTTLRCYHLRASDPSLANSCHHHTSQLDDSIQQQQQQQQQHDTSTNNTAIAISTPTASHEELKMTSSHHHLLRSTSLSHGPQTDIPTTNRESVLSSSTLGGESVTCNLTLGGISENQPSSQFISTKELANPTTTSTTTMATITSPRKHRKVHNHKLSRQAILNDDTDQNEDDVTKDQQQQQQCQTNKSKSSVMAINITSKSLTNDLENDGLDSGSSHQGDEYSPILSGVRDYIENVHSSEALKLHTEPTTMIMIDPQVVADLVNCSSGVNSSTSSSTTRADVLDVIANHHHQHHHLKKDNVIVSSHGIVESSSGSAALTTSSISASVISSSSRDALDTFDSPKKSIFDGASKDEILEYLEDARERVPDVLIAADEVMAIGDHELILVNQLEPNSPATPISIVDTSADTTQSPPTSAHIIGTSQQQQVASCNKQSADILAISAGNQQQTSNSLDIQRDNYIHTPLVTSHEQRVIMSEFSGCGAANINDHLMRKGVQISASQLDSIDSISRLTMSFDERTTSPSDDYHSIFTSGTQSSIDSSLAGLIGSGGENYHQRCMSDSDRETTTTTTSGLQCDLERAKMATLSSLIDTNANQLDASQSRMSQDDDELRVLTAQNTSSNTGNTTAASDTSRLQISDQVASMLRHSPRLKSNSESSSVALNESLSSSLSPQLASDHAIRMLLLQKRHSTTTANDLFSSTTSTTSSGSSSSSKSSSSSSSSSTSSSSTSSSSSPPSSTASSSSSATNSPPSSASNRTSGNCSATSNFYASPSLSCSSPFLAHHHLSSGAPPVFGSPGFHKFPAPCSLVSTLINPARCLPNYDTDLVLQSNSPTNKSRAGLALADTAQVRKSFRQHHQLLNTHQLSAAAAAATAIQEPTQLISESVERDDSGLEVEFPSQPMVKTTKTAWHQQQQQQSPLTSIIPSELFSGGGGDKAPASPGANEQVTATLASNISGGPNSRLSVIAEQILEKSPTKNVAAVDLMIGSGKVDKPTTISVTGNCNLKNTSRSSAIFSTNKSFLSTGGNNSSTSSSLGNKISIITRPLHSHYATINRLNNYLINRSDVITSGTLTSGGVSGGGQESIIEFQCLDCDQFTVTDQARVLHKANELRLLRESEIGSLEQEKNGQQQQMTLDQIDRAYVAALNGLPLCKSCEKKRGERKEIVWEFVDTELKYGRDLRIIHDEFYRPMQIAGLLNKDQLDGIFLNLDKLLLAHCKFAARLEVAVAEAQSMGDGDYNSVNIGRLFVESADMLHTFESYCIRQGSAACLLARLAKEKELLRIFLRVSQMENTLLRRMNLAAFLMVPVQRVTKYPLLLNRLYKVTPYHHKDREALRDAQLKVELHLEHINQQTKGVSATNKIWRRISNLSAGPNSAQQAAANRRGLISAEDIGYIKLRKSAIELLKWDRDEMQFIHSGKINFAPLNEYLVKQKAKSIRYMTAHALLIVSGKPNWKYRPDLVKSSLDNKLLIPTPGGSGIKEAALLLFREKNGRFVACREPILLSNCVLSNDCSLFNSELTHNNNNQSQPQSHNSSSSTSGGTTTSSLHKSSLPGSTSSAISETGSNGGGKSVQIAQSSSLNRRLSPGLMSLDNATAAAAAPIGATKKDLIILNECRAASADRLSQQTNVSSSASSSIINCSLINSADNVAVVAAANMAKQKSLCSKGSDASATSDLIASAQCDSISMSSLKSLPGEKSASLYGGSGGGYSPPIQTSRSYSLASALPRVPITSHSTKVNTPASSTTLTSTTHTNTNPTILNQLMTKVNNYHHNQQLKQQQQQQNAGINTNSIVKVNSRDHHHHHKLATTKTQSANCCIVESVASSSTNQTNGFSATTTTTNHQVDNNGQQRGSSTTNIASGALSDGGSSTLINQQQQQHHQYTNHHHYYHNHNQQPYGDYEESFELHERLSKESLLLRADTPLKTRYWLQMLRYHAKDLGNWRTRRHGLANIMMMRQE